MRLPKDTRPFLPYKVLSKTCKKKPCFSLRVWIGVDLICHFHLSFHQHQLIHCAAFEQIHFGFMSRKASRSIQRFVSAAGLSFDKKKSMLRGVEEILNGLNGGLILEAASAMQDAKGQSDKQQKLDRLFETNRDLKQKLDAQLAENVNERKVLKRMQTECQKLTDEWKQKESDHAVEFGQIRELKQRSTDVFDAEQKMRAKQLELETRALNLDKQCEEMRRKEDEMNRREESLAAQRAAVQTAQEQIHNLTARVNKDRVAFEVEKETWLATQKTREKENKDECARIMTLQRQCEIKAQRVDRLTASLRQKHSELAADRVRWQAAQSERKEDAIREQNVLSTLVHQRASMEAHMIGLVHQYVNQEEGQVEGQEAQAADQAGVEGQQLNLMIAVQG